MTDLLEYCWSIVGEGRGEGRLSGRFSASWRYSVEWRSRRAGSSAVSLGGLTAPTISTPTRLDTDSSRHRLTSTQTPQADGLGARNKRRGRASRRRLHTDAQGAFKVRPQATARSQPRSPRGCSSRTSASTAASPASWGAPTSEPQQPSRSPHSSSPRVCPTSAQTQQRCASLLCVSPLKGLHRVICFKELLGGTPGSYPPPTCMQYLDRL